MLFNMHVMPEDLASLRPYCWPQCCSALLQTQDMRRGLSSSQTQPKAAHDVASALSELVYCTTVPPTGSADYIPSLVPYAHSLDKSSSSFYRLNYYFLRLLPFFHPRLFPSLLDRPVSLCGHTFSLIAAL